MKEENLEKGVIALIQLECRSDQWTVRNEAEKNIFENVSSDYEKSRDTFLSKVPVDPLRRCSYGMSVFYLTVLPLPYDSHTGVTKILSSGSVSSGSTTGTATLLALPLWLWILTVEICSESLCPTIVPRLRVIVTCPKSHRNWIPTRPPENQKNIIFGTPSGISPTRSVLMSVQFILLQ